MVNIPEDIIHFLNKENFTIVSTIDEAGRIHNSCKGIVSVDPKGKIYLLDLYHEKTYHNLQKNKNISITVVNEHKFQGYSLIGNAEIAASSNLTDDMAKAWEKRIAGRISQRIIKNLQGEKGHPSHPEAVFPEPKYMIVAEIESIVDMSPQPLE